MESTETESGSISWKESLPEDIKEDPSLGSIEPVENLAKSYVNAQRLIGKDKIVVPGEFATEEEWKTNVFSKLGLPDSVDKYEIQVAGGEALDQEFFGGFKKAAHEAGVLPTQAQKIFDWYGKEAVRQGEAATQAAQTNVNEKVEELKKDWGGAYEAKVKAAQAAVAHFTDTDFKEYLDESGLGNDPNLIKTFAKIGETLTEDQFKESGPVKLGTTPTDAQAQINTVMGDPNHAYHNKNHPNHKNAVAEVQRMYQHLG